MRVASFDQLSFVRELSLFCNGVVYYKVGCSMVLCSIVGFGLEFGLNRYGVVRVAKCQMHFLKVYFLKVFLSSYKNVFCQSVFKTFISISHIQNCIYKILQVAFLRYCHVFFPNVLSQPLIGEELIRLKCFALKLVLHG